jgi:transposase-like protein
VKITLLFPEVKEQANTRPRGCPRCGSAYIARHAVVSKPIRDTKINQAQIVRYLCSECGKSFRHYPDGVGRARQSHRLMSLAAIMQALGLSCSATSHLLGILSKTTVWRDVQRAGMALRGRPSLTGKVGVIGADETWVKLKGQPVCLGFVVDGDTGETLGIEILVERDSHAFLLWLKKLAKELGAEMLVTDDLSTYKPVAQRLGLKHQICLTHVRKNVTKRLKKLSGQEAVKDAVRDIIKELPPWGDRVLRELAKALRKNTSWRMFLRELADKYESLCLYLHEKGVPATNNVTERAIGRSKVRYKTIRGFKSKDGMLNLFALTQWLYTPKEIHDLAALVA